jgi:hypothetical protein
MQNAADDPRFSPSEKKSWNRYRWEFIAAMTLYTILLIASVKTVRHLDGLAKYLDAVLPVLGGLAIVVSIVRLGMRMDELQRQTFVNAAAIALFVTSLVTMTLGFLENAGVPPVNMTFVFPIAILSWGAAWPFFRKRYL